MKLLWLSANKLGYAVFPELLHISGVTISGIITLSPTSKTMMYDGIETDLWKQWDIPVFEIERIEEEKELIQKLAPDIIVMCGWRQKIPPEILSIPSKGFIGFHPTLLPFGRGPAPLINSILEGITQTGVTMFYLTEELDNGDIIGQEPFIIENNDYAGDVYNKIIDATRMLIRHYIPQLISGNAPRIPQDESKATYFPQRTLKDNEIDMEHDDPKSIMRKIRAFSTPYRGAFIQKSDKKIIIWKASVEGDDL